MRRQHLEAALILTLVGAVAVAASAQERERRSAPAPREPRTMTFLRGPGDDGPEMRRGRLGITVDMRPDAGRDSVGARVSGVTPGGPADHAGVQTGDVITRLNGTRLVPGDNNREGNDEMSRPAMRLINLASRLDAGDTVRLDLNRDDRPMTLTFVAGESDMDQIVERMRMPGFSFDMGPGMMGQGVGPGIGMVRVMMNGLSSLELVKVNAGLGEYFGTTDGLLVVDIGQDTATGLRAGDVILTIGGRRATSPPQAMRILGTYEPTEAVQFEVMRQKRRTTVNGHMPRREEHQWRIRPNSLENFDATQYRREAERMMELMPRMMERQMPPRMKIEIDGVPKTMLRIDGKV